MKLCFKCRQLKPLDEFYRHQMMGDGHLGKCKGCTKRDVMENRNRRLAKYREFDRLRYMVNADRAARNKEWKGMNPAKVSKYRSEWAERNRDKRVAHRAVARAIKSGRLQRQPCEKCGLAAQSHHDDYSKPLDVRWLCPLHHSDTHRKERGQCNEMLSSTGV